MCGIGIVRADKLVETLRNQKDRGLDSIGLIINGRTTRLLEPTYKKYKNKLRKIKSDKAVIMHHRKATIGAITLDNAHPFQGKKFSLMQNGTSPDFFKSYGTFYGKETDSETLLSYVESRASKIEEIPAILDKLGFDMQETFGIIIITDGNKILFYADGFRESYIKLNEDKTQVEYIVNYIPNGYYGYENFGHILMDNDLNVLENTFEELNQSQFVSPWATYVPSTTGTVGFDTGDYKYEAQLASYYTNNVPNEELTGHDLVADDVAEYEYMCHVLDENVTKCMFMDYAGCKDFYLQVVYDVPDTSEFWAVYGYAFPRKAMHAAFNDTIVYFTKAGVGE